MRRRVVNGEEEGLGFLGGFGDEIQGVAGDRVRQVFGDQLPVAGAAVEPVHHGPVIGTAATLQRKPVAEAFAWNVAGPQVPFAGEAQAVAGIAQGIREQCLPLEVVHCFRPCFDARQVVVDAVARGDVPRHQAGAGRRADGRHAKEVLQTRSAGREGIQIGSLNLGVSGAPQRPSALVVAQDEDDVRIFFGHPSLLRSTEARNQ
jgi:hypothetical protein